MVSEERPVVLLVEDDPVTARSIERGLRRGARVVAVSSAASAAEVLRRAAFAAVWSDLDLGGPTTGVEVLQLAARTQPTAALYLVTGSVADVHGEALDARVVIFPKSAMAVAIQHVLLRLEIAADA